MSTKDLARYTVGWVCALEVEAAASCLALDEVYDDASCPVTSRDGTSYVCGKIKDHDVVLAFPANASIIGPGKATVAAKHMLSIFPNIRIVLMVGIGSGIPSFQADDDSTYEPSDVRLGDIVVGKELTPYVLGPSQGHDSGVEFIHAYTTTTQVLRDVIRKLKISGEDGGRALQTDLESQLEDREGFAERFFRPPVATDQLFVSKHVHRGKAADSCSGLCDQQSEGILVQRPERSSEDGPSVHYACIASGSQVVKDAGLRDRAVDEFEEVLCFETGAAGFKGNIPCLFVRGICDYADSHNYDAWHGYAAMTAATYAARLLHLISRETVEGKCRPIHWGPDRVPGGACQPS